MLEAVNYREQCLSIRMIGTQTTRDIWQWLATFWFVMTWWRGDYCFPVGRGILLNILQSKRQPPQEESLGPKRQKCHRNGEGSAFQEREKCISDTEGKKKREKQGRRKC